MAVTVFSRRNSWALLREYPEGRPFLAPGALAAAVKDAAETQFIDLGQQGRFPGIERLVEQEVFLAVRPENITIEAAAGVNETRVEVVEPQGAYTILVVKVLGAD
jgi:hypothetical protein